MKTMGIYSDAGNLSRGNLLIDQRMHLYALSLQAIRLSSDDEAEYELYSMAIMAPTPELAYEVAMKRAARQWPPSEGWIEHSVSSCEIPDWMIGAAASSMFEPQVA